MKKGFTLIELLVVVLIIGILSAVALPQYKKAVARAHLSEIITVSKSLEKAEKVYFMANGTYTTNFDELDISLPSGATKSSANENRYVYPNGTYYEILGPLGGWRLNSGGPKVKIIYQILFQADYDTCMLNDDDGGIGDYLCKSLGGVANGTSNNGKTSYRISK